MKGFRKSRLIILAAGIAISGTLLISGFFAWRAYVIDAQEGRSLMKAKELLAASRPEAAFALIRENKQPAGSKRKAEWLSLEVQALAEMRNIPRLLHLYERSPETFLAHEGASLLVARFLLHTGKLEALATLRDKWRSIESQEALWFYFDVDRMIVAGKASAAREMLSARTFKGKQDCGRLTRLALLTAATDLEAAWSNLDRAYALDPYNPDVRSFRAQILEHIGKLPMARVEYVAAHLADPDNPLLSDQLAEYYRRSGNYGLALKTWSQNLAAPSIDYLWLKTYFWSRVAKPVHIDWAPLSAASGNLKPLLAYLHHLPQGTFWDAGAFLGIPNARMFLNRRQEVYWLRLIQALKDGEESQALELLGSDTFGKKSWSPTIEAALKQVLTYRAWSAFPAMQETVFMAGLASATKHQFFKQLGRLSEAAATGQEAAKVPEDLDLLLRSEEAFAAVFMAGGWLEAALQLHRMPKLPSGFPEWYAYGMTQTLRFNRGNQAALDFAEEQTQTSVMALLKAELLLAEGRPQEGLASLAVLSLKQTDAGHRAAWLLALFRLEEGDTRAARKVLLSQRRLADSTMGQEMQARIALAEGDFEEAQSMYAALANASDEAKVFLAKQAYGNEDWKTARRLTEELLLRYPDRMQLRANLAAISKAEIGL